MICERFRVSTNFVPQRAFDQTSGRLLAHLGFRVLIGQQAHDVRGDEARAARDEDCLRHFTRRACAAACSVVHRECRETLQVRVYKCGKLRVTISVIKKLHP